MQLDLQGVKLAVWGGDARTIVLVEQLANWGASVEAVGLPVKNPKVAVLSELKETSRDIQALILPIPGVDEQKKIYAVYHEQPLILSVVELASFPTGLLVFVGVAQPYLKEIAVHAGLELIEIMNLDETAILNSIPSAEGAIQMVMERLPITIHDSRALVLGFGRTGITLVRMLAAIGAHVTVIARDPAQRARAYEMGVLSADLLELSALMPQADVIFNTVPALILSRPLLEKAAPEVLIIDLASAPGGTDFTAAQELGISAALSPGLPGRVAPKTAGVILARVIRRILLERLAS
ncbi:dipicolinate synthase [Peptococcaceae bacterium SCADC1_2_3]|nr:dipicolinate synthase [Peptococcaceae bacterium SCADC1_2_3]KFI35733.1 dipicolinate synthase [Peptococcaceae bacterium SCADC1_2_3]KFI37592.1 dipicolinate synthase [Peptococcaceae bacterium SCADC1_2_3]HBQ28343.1 dipicolinate synthase subunit DpsA [Desulfotomaculum sp.]HCJ78769.1 dipicolinate synthase subunit DpsA [Desulfotomaculum sp.]